MNRSAAPSSSTMAKDRGSGVWGTSAPRILSSHAMLSGCVSTTAVCPAFRSDCRGIRQFFRSRLAGEAQVVGHHGSQRGRRLVRPDGIDRVVGAGQHFAPALPSAERIRSTHPTVWSHGSYPSRPPWGSTDAAQSACGSSVRCLYWNNAGRYFRLDLERVAAIDEDGGLIQHHDGKPGRAGEPGNPGQPVGTRRNIFPLVLIRPGHARNRKARAGSVRTAGPRPARHSPERGECRLAEASSSRSAFS